MLFNSIEFIFVFFPTVVLIFFLLGKWSQTAAMYWLAATSLAFYGWWDPRYLGLLLASVVVNYTFGRLISQNSGQMRFLLGGIATNLLLLGYFKYANFFIENVEHATGIVFEIERIILPLGISFFTFTQIAYLVDAYRAEVREYSFQKYLLFVTFFPHLIAGPILHHREIMPQFDHPGTFRPDWDKVAQGLMFFTLGLAKKVLLADGIARFSGEVFDAARMEPVSFFEAWQAALAYTLQLYFDFSGYCDMAVGAALILGIQIPFNFASPYKARNIIEFWRRWHMTLSRFLRDYLYIPLGGNRRGPKRRYLNLMIVMLLGGLWHGAGWTFVVWGGLHGFYLLVNHAWRTVFSSEGQGSKIMNTGAWTLTFLCTVIAWVFFRADDIGSALNIVRGMVGLNGFELESVHRLYLGPLAGLLESFGVVFVEGTHVRLPAVPWIIGLLMLSLLAPNTQEWIAVRRPVLGAIGRWQPSLCWGVGMAFVAVAVVSLVGQASAFLYFNF